MDVKVTMESGAGTMSGVTAGTRIVTRYNPAGNALEETVQDIASNLVVSTKLAVDVDIYGRVLKWVYDNNPADYSETAYACCGVERERGRDGLAIDYMHDGVGRVISAIRTDGIMENTEYNGLVTRLTRSPVSGGPAVLVSETTRDLGGRVILSEAPDADGDNVPEATTYAYGTNSVTITNPVGATAITTNATISDERQIASVTGTAVPNTDYAYRLWTGGQTQTVYQKEGAVRTQWRTTYTDYAGRVVREEASPGGSECSTFQTYNAAGQLVKTAAPDGKTTLYAYNAQGEGTISAIDMNGNGVIDYAGPDRITESSMEIVNDPVLGVSRKTTEKIYAQDNASPTVLAVSYRAANGRASRTESFGASSSSVKTFPVNGAWTQTSTGPDGVKQVQEFENWRAKSITVKDANDAQVTRTTLAYNNLGRLTASTDARTGTTTFSEYYADGSVRKVVSPHNADTTIYTHDALGRTTDTQLPDGSHRSVSYTLAGQLEWSTGSQTYPTRNVYDEQGRMAELHTFKDGTQGAPQITRWHYDTATGAMTFKEYADGKGPHYAYRPGGRLLTRTWARGITTTYAYNAAGDLTGVDYGDSTPDVAMSYNRLGQPTSADNGVAATAYTYDGSFRLAAEASSGAVARTLSRAYDALGRPSSMEVLNGQAVEHHVEYGYDSAGRIGTVSQGSGLDALALAYSYVPNSGGLVATMTGPVNTVTNVYEPSRDVLVSKENKTGATILSRSGYATNALEQRTSLEQSGTAFQQPMISLFGYDTLGQVISTNTYTGGTLAQPQDPALGRQFKFAYDAIGNRTSATDGTVGAAYVANALNQYTEIAGVAPAYDDDGNMLDDGTLLYAWDGENRLRSVIRRSDTALVASYSYDYQSRRVGKSTTAAASQGAASSAFAYDGWNLTAEYSVSGGNAVLSATNLWGIDLSGSSQGAGGIGGLLVRNSGGTAAHYAYDANGNVSELLDSTGAISAHYEYGPFGELLRPAGISVDNNPFRFSCKYQDSESGLLYYGYRYYQTIYGRWLNRDPIQEEGGENIYAAVNNDLAGGIDALGLIASPNILDAIYPLLPAKVTAIYGDFRLWVFPIAPPAVTVELYVFFNINISKCCDRNGKGHFMATGEIGAELNGGFGTSVGGNSGVQVNKPAGSGYSRKTVHNNIRPTPPPTIFNDGNPNRTNTRSKQEALYGGSASSCPEGISGSIVFSIGVSGFASYRNHGGAFDYQIGSCSIPGGCSLTWKTPPTGGYVYGFGTGARLQVYGRGTGSFSFTIPGT